MLSTILDVILLLLSPLVDFVNYFKIIKFKTKGKISRILILLIFLVTVFEEIVTDLIAFPPFDALATIIEMGLLILVCSRSKKDYRMLLTGALIIGIIDLGNNIVVSFFGKLFDMSAEISTVIYIFLVLLSYIFISYYAKKINKLISGRNKNILLNSAIYLYISSIIAYIIASIEKTLSTALVILIGILIIQGVYTIVNVKISVRTSKNILNEAEQNYLKKQNAQLQRNNNQLKEYANSLEKDEDRLRRFKHDYRNILNSLKISAQKEDSKVLIKQLDEYTKEHFDSDALSKFKDVNHIHDELVKSIIITKLSKMFNNGIKYRFSCEKDINTFPFLSSSEHMDVVRILGITFDNAIEATKKEKDPKIEAMLYQNNGNLEFIIRNSIAKEINKNEVFQMGHTIKENHSGIGLNNVLKIVEKYPNNMMVDINTEAGWFTFNLVIFK